MDQTETSKLLRVRAHSLCVKIFPNKPEQIDSPKGRNTKEQERIVALFGLDF